jgi:hypothetical protein
LGQPGHHLVLNWQANRPASQLADNYQSWDSSFLVTQKFTWGGTWGSFPDLRVQHGLQGTTAGEADKFRYQYVSLARAGSRYWLTTYIEDLFSPAGKSQQAIAFSDDGAFFSDGLVLGAGGNDDDTLQYLSLGDLVSDDRVYRSDKPATLSADERQIMAYKLTDNGADAELSLTLDNRGGEFDGLETGRLGAHLLLERGAVAGGTARRVARETFIVTAITWQARTARVSLTGFNFYGLLERWRVAQVYYFSGYSLGQLVEALAALAGIQAITVDASSIWSTTIAEFAIRPGQTILKALQVLMAQYQFLVRIDENDRLDCFTLADAPASDYSLAGLDNAPAGAHPTFLAQDTAARRLPGVTRAVVVGDGLTVSADRTAAALQAEASLQFAGYVTSKYITSQAQAEAAADAVITKSEQSISHARLHALPAFHLQPYDVVTCGDWTTNQVRYISRIRERYDIKRRDRPWQQELELAAVVGTHGIKGVGGVSFTRGGLAIRRGEVVSFSSSGYTAVIRMELTQASVSMSVGSGYQPA